MLFLRLRKGGQLLGAGFTLMLCLPLGEWFAIDEFAGLILAQRLAALLGCLAVPVGQAIATEARLGHQIDVLHVAAAIEMLQQATKCGSFEFSSDVGHRHSRFLSARRDALIVAFAFERFATDMDNAAILMEFR